MTAWSLDKGRRENTKHINANCESTEAEINLSVIPAWNSCSWESIFSRRKINAPHTTTNINIILFMGLLCTYQCKSRWGGVRARGGDLMPETIPMSGFSSCEATQGSGQLTLTNRSLVSIQKRLPSPSLEAF